MRIQDHLIDSTRKAQEEAFAYAKAVPEDKADWKPLDAGRSVLDLARELAQCPDWTYDLVATGRLDWSEEAQAASKAESDAWTTVADCDAACREKLERVYALCRDFPDARLAETVDLPFGPGGSMKTFTLSDILAFPCWNFTYHLGQIAYIQTLYGDREMH